MFNSMDRYIVNSLVKVCLLHAIPVLFHQTEGSFNSSAEGFHFLINETVISATK